MVNSKNPIRCKPHPIDKNNVRINGEKIFLRFVREEDVYGNWWRWFNDPDVTAHMNKGVKKNTVEDQLAFFEKIQQSEKDVVLAICDRQTGRHIGTTGLHDIDWEKGSAQFGIVIGEKKFRGQGIGTEVWSMIVSYGFDKLKLQKIHTKIFAENLSSIRIATKCGFEQKAILKSDVEKKGVRYDRVYMVLTRERWKGTRKGKT